MRKIGSRNTLVKIDYDLIGDLVGIAGNTAKQYAHRGEYDPRNLESVLRWINGRRVQKGLSLIGLPSEDPSAADADGSLIFMPASVRNELLYYDYVRGEYRTDEMTGSMAFRR